MRLWRSATLPGRSSTCARCHMSLELLGYAWAEPKVVLLQCTRRRPMTPTTLTPVVVLARATLGRSTSAVARWSRFSYAQAKTESSARSPHARASCCARDTNACSVVAAVYDRTVLSSSISGGRLAVPTYWQKTDGVRRTPLQKLWYRRAPLWGAASNLDGVEVGPPILHCRWAETQSNVRRKVHCAPWLGHADPASRVESCFSALLRARLRTAKTSGGQRTARPTYWAVDSWQSWRVEFHLD